LYKSTNKYEQNTDHPQSVGKKAYSLKTNILQPSKNNNFKFAKDNNQNFCQNNRTMELNDCDTSQAPYEEIPDVHKGANSYGYYCSKYDTSSTSHPTTSLLPEELIHGRNWNEEFQVILEKIRGKNQSS
jgi:hypothetical protein